MVNILLIKNPKALRRLQRVRFQEPCPSRTLEAETLTTGTLDPQTGRGVEGRFSTKAATDHGWKPRRTASYGPGPHVTHPLGSALGTMDKEAVLLSVEVHCVTGCPKLG